jgi:glycine hydroxymethyltransferase
MVALKKIKEIVKEQNQWRKSKCINLIASENLLSPLAERFLISDFVGRYNEHGVKNGKFESHYQGTKYSCQIEKVCNQIFGRKFKTKFVDVRPISGAIANLAIYRAILKSGDVFLAPGLTFGAHVSSTEYGIAGVCGLKSIPMPFDIERMQLNVKETIKLIKKVKPKLIMLGRSMFLFPEPIRKIRKYTKAIIVYDAAHVFGLIYAGFFQNPFKEGADIITASTHKTFPGPQGGIILGSPKLDKKVWKKIQNAIFPGIISNHHIFRLPSLAITALEMNKFGKVYAKQIIKNAKTLAFNLFRKGFEVLAKDFSFTQSHQVIVDVKRFGGGKKVSERLEKANIILNKMALPYDTDKDATQNPSGIRIGVQEVTRVGMKEKEMEIIADFFKKVIINRIEPQKVKRKVIKFRKRFQEIKYCSYD